MSDSPELTDEELAARLEELSQEHQQRRERSEKETKKAQLAAQIDRLLMAYKLLVTDGEKTEWAQPVSAVDAYPRGAVVTHQGQQWESTVAANVWQPGTSGWRKAPETDETGTEIPPAYLQPTGAHDAYLDGDRITWEDGEVYEAARDGIVHTPEESPEDWRLIERHDTEPPEDPDEDEDEDPGDDDQDNDDPGLIFPEWVKPTGAHDAYEEGDVVTFEGQAWESLISANTWKPTENPSGWQQVDDEYEVES